MGLNRRGALRNAAGHVAVRMLRLIARCPWPLVRACGNVLLPVYILLRARTRPNLRRLSPPLPPLAYYRMRLRLAWLSLRHAEGLPDGCSRHVEGMDVLDDALSGHRHVVLLGWHQGPVELLHALPVQHLRARGNTTPCYVMTASAFSPALAEWMAACRAADGTIVLDPGNRDGLRAFARDGGVLALMADQVPGDPEDRIALRDGTSAPFPSRLVAWLAALRPAFVAVSVRLDGNAIRFRCRPLDAGNPKPSLAACVSDALHAAPEQYNWSYGKITRDP